MIKVLFICIHNSARSQMAEAYLKLFGKDKFVVESAGLEPGSLNQNVVKVLLEDGIDISRNKTKSVFDLLKNGKTYDYVITVCDADNDERCPVFPGKTTRLHWDFKDPSGFNGSIDEITAKTRAVRDQIKNKIIKFIENFN